MIAGVDAHLARIETCLSSLKSVYTYNEVDYGVATFGNKNLPQSKILPAYCTENGYLFYDDERQGYLTRFEFHSCEVLGLFSISRHFYSLGYKKVFILHNDMIIFRDFIPLYESYMTGKWSFIVPFVNIDLGYGNYEEHQTARHRSTEELKKSPYRMPQTIVILNKELIDVVYNKYGSNKSLWDNCFDDISMYGDVGLISISEDFLGYCSNPIYSETEASLRWCSKDEVITKVKENEVYYVHGVDTCSVLQ